MHLILLIFALHIFHYSSFIQEASQGLLTQTQVMPEELCNLLLLLDVVGMPLIDSEITHF